MSFTGSAVDTGKAGDVLPISTWLSSIKLQDYVDLFTNSGYDSTDLVIGLTSDVSLPVTSHYIGPIPSSLSVCQIQFHQLHALAPDNS